MRVHQLKARGIVEGAAREEQYFDFGDAVDILFSAFEVFDSGAELFDGLCLGACVVFVPFASPRSFEQRV